LGERKIEAVLQRLDKLTREEARMTIAQTLREIQDLEKNIKVIMVGG